MKFSDTTNNQGLIEDIDFLVNTNSSAYTTNDKTRNINRWYYKVVSWIWDSSRLWEFDDKNYTTQPVAVTDLVADQQDYELPDSTLSVMEVNVKDSSGEWKKLEYIDSSEISIAREEFMEDSGLPRYYDLVGESLYLYPAPGSADVTTTSGLKLYLAREIDSFSPSDTDKEPGFAENFHRILSLGAAYDFAIAKGLENATQLSNAIKSMKKELYSHYSRRDREEQIRIKPNRESYI